MGRNLALNIESRGYAVSVYNRSREKTDELIAEFPAAIWCRPIRSRNSSRRSKRRAGS